MATHEHPSHDEEEEESVDSAANSGSDDDDTVTATDDAETEEDEAPDVLLTEAGNVLVDTLMMGRQRYAVADKKES